MDDRRPLPAKLFQQLVNAWCNLLHSTYRLYACVRIPHVANDDGHSLRIDTQLAQFAMKQPGTFRHRYLISLLHFDSLPLKIG
jgi:hypothetical protein